jgi:2-dehydro-3-deoxyphosphogluconate aldolase/(4S)-4-hydroxy-2-oxoglutarate aldolase
MTATAAGAAARARRDAVVERIAALGAVAVVRLPNADAAHRVVEALHAGGVSAVEVTVTTRGALDAIEAVSREFGDAVLVGVGSVLDAATAREAVERGARYVVSPVFDPEVVAEAQRLEAPAMPGAFTPTEILRAHRAGADVVKVFPSDALGPAFVKGVLGPMPFLKLMPTGGVTPENVGDWVRAGVVAVGLGSALVDPKLVAAGDFAALTERARRLVGNMAEARAALRAGSAR